jgi:hypothetical protein
MIIDSMVFCWSAMALVVIKFPNGWGKIPELSSGGLNDLRPEVLLDCRRDNVLGVPVCSNLLNGRK